MGALDARPALERPQRPAGSETRSGSMTFAFRELNCAGHEEVAPFRHPPIFT